MCGSDWEHICWARTHAGVGTQRRNPLAALPSSEGECGLAVKAEKVELWSRRNHNGCYFTINVLLGLPNKYALKVKILQGWRKGWGVARENGSLPFLPVSPLVTRTLLINDLWKSGVDDHRGKRKTISSAHKQESDGS